MNKLGNYITKLMTTVLDMEQEEFVRELALSELTRLNVDKEKEKQDKKLLQEDKNVKDK